MNKPKFIIIHDSASPFGDLLTINQWHKERGFKWVNPRSGVEVSAGYHYLIYNGFLQGGSKYNQLYDGLIVPARPEHVEGAHCRSGGMNKKSLGVCLVGDESFSESQLYALRLLVFGLCSKYKIDLKNILGHKEVDKKKQDPRLDLVKLRSVLEITERT